jgi:hypothetical protein
LKLLAPDTTWVFVSGSDEDRFLCDILFGIQCLLHQKLKPQRIILFVDQPSGSAFMSVAAFPAGIAIYRTVDMEKELLLRQTENLVMVVTGHGGSRGIAAQPDIQPYKLLNTIRNLPNLKTALIVLGQCYAGTFNFLEARSTDDEGKVVPPEFCLIGATELASSLSVGINISPVPIINQFACPTQWSANLFLFYFMVQVADPIDYDGDGLFTVLDAYKAAGIGTNADLLSIRQQSVKQFYETVVSSTLGELTQTPEFQKLAEKARQDLLASADVLLTNQSPWILNANLARKLEL